MRTTVRLPQDLLSRAKRKAAADGVTLTALIEEGLRIALTAPSRTPQKKRARVRISEATGGLMPALEAVDPAKLATAIEEMDDLERMQRRTRAK